jgi:hypothetical protein
VGRRERLFPPDDPTGDFGLTDLAIPSGLSVADLGVFGADGFADHTGDIVRVPLQGPAVTLAAQQQVPRRAVADAAFVYWGTGEGDVLRVPIEGGATETLASGLHWSIGLALDADSVYWADWGRLRGDSHANHFAMPSTGAILRVAKTGGPVTTLVAGRNQPAELVLDTQFLYWVESGVERAGGAEPIANTGKVLRVPLAGGEVTTLASRQDAPWSPWLDGPNLYWTLQEHQRIARAPRGGGPIASLRTGSQPVGVVTDEKSLYWVEYGGGAILKVTPK